MFNDISWIEGMRDYIRIHLKTGNKPLVVRSTIKAIEAELPRSKFIRIHKSFIRFNRQYNFNQEKQCVYQRT
jgi:DNA-binding LytR/AlgR family response regulator